MADNALCSRSSLCSGVPGQNPLCLAPISLRMTSPSGGSQSLGKQAAAEPIARFPGVPDMSESQAKLKLELLETGRKQACLWGYSKDTYVREAEVWKGSTRLN